MLKKDVLRALEGPLYSKLGYRERRILDMAAIRPEKIEFLYDNLNGTIITKTPSGSFEVAWNLPGYERGTVVG
jgi:hypothetical protein